LAVLAMISAESIVFMCPVEGAKFSLNSQHGNISCQRAGFCFISSELTEMKKLRSRQCEFSQHYPKYPAAVINLLGLYRICVVLQNLMTLRRKQSFRFWSFNKMYSLLISRFPRVLEILGKKKKIQGPEKFWKINMNRYMSLKVLGI